MNPLDKIKKNLDNKIENNQEEEKEIIKEKKNEIEEENKQEKEEEKKKKIYKQYIDEIDREINSDKEINDENKKELINKMEKWDDKYINENGEYEVFIKKIYIKNTKMIIKYQNDLGEIAIKSYDLNNENQLYYFKRDIEILLNKIGTQRENFDNPKLASAFLMNYTRQNILKLKIKIEKKENNWINILII